MSEAINLGFLGAGRMGEALLTAAAREGSDYRLHAFDPEPRPGLQQSLPMVRFHSDACGLEDACQLIVLCVKPQDMPVAAAPLRGNKRYLSIAAGLSLQQLGAMIPGASPAQLARAMPNISALVGASASAYFTTSDSLASEVERILKSAGSALRVAREELLHAVTGLSGSGPAYVCEFIHALAEGGVAEGLSFDAALQLAVQTLRGTAAMLESGRHPIELRNQVASPAGTTISGLRALEERAFHAAVMDAVCAAAQRSRQLGEIAGDARQSRATGEAPR
ncbi:MAG: pyrroline-5-carboxylate reductase [Leptospirales bacterium]|nr:pyrroline-5-carboxylate reductase [Leptospirales bacterium]